MLKNQLVRSLFFLILLSSCGFFQKTAVGLTADVMYQSTDKLKGENSLDTFEMAVPGTIYVMESLTEVLPEDEELLVSLTKAYSGYAFVIHETSFLEDSLSKKDNEGSLRKILETYSKAMKFGLRFLNTQKITLEDLKNNINSPEGIQGLLDGKLKQKEKVQLEGVLFTAHSLASLVNYQKGSIAFLAYLPIAKGMFDWVCKIQPDLGEGICDIFYGAYFSSRPAQLGGDPVKGKKIFQDLINKNPNNWLSRVAYIQFNLIPLNDKEGYLEQKLVMEKAVLLNEEELNWSPRGLREPEIFSNERIRLYQAVAVRRYEMLRKYEKDLFL